MTNTTRRSGRVIVVSLSLAAALSTGCGRAEAAPTEPESLPQGGADPVDLPQQPPASCDAMPPVTPGEPRVIPDLLLALKGSPASNTPEVPCWPEVSTDGEGALLGAIGPVRSNMGHGTVEGGVFRPASPEPSGHFEGLIQRLAPQPRGFVGFVEMYASFGQVQLTAAALDGSGTLVPVPGTTRTVRARDLASDPRGGSVLATVEDGAPADGERRVRLQRFSATGAPQGGVQEVARFPVPTNAFELDAVVAGLDRTGRVLVLFKGPGADATQGQWFSFSADVARPDGAAFDAQTAWSGILTAGAQLVPLLPDGLALRVGEVWVHRFTGPGGVAPAPDWLARRPGARPVVVRGGAGYALLPADPRLGEEPVCPRTVELHAADGTLCSSFSVEPPGGPGCSAAGLRLGADGALLERSGPQGCSLRVWPGLLR